MVKLGANKNIRIIMKVKGSIFGQWESLQKVDEAFRESAFRTGVVDASNEHHNKAPRQHTFFSGFPVTALSAFLTTPLACREVSGCESESRVKCLTLATTDGFFAGAAFFLVTPTGLLALVAVAFFGPRLAPVLAVARFLVVVGAVSVTVGKTLGRECPVCEVQHRSFKLRAEPYQSWRRQQRVSIKTDRSPNECLHEPLFPMQELV